MVFEVIGTSATALTDPTVDEPAISRTLLPDPDLDEGILDRTLLDDTVLGSTFADTALDEAILGTPVADPGPGAAPGLPTMRPAPPRARRPLPAGVVRQLLRSAVALQAEGVLRTAGALAGTWGGVLDRTEWIERDARDLSLLAAAAVAADVPLPAGLDTGAGDPDHPVSVAESLLAGHQALVHVLRQLADEPADGEAAAAAPWRDVVRGVLSRREEEMRLLRAVGAVGELPADERYVHGRPPRI